MSASAHSVQFYDQDDYLLDAAAGFLIAGINQAQPIVVIATEEHRQAFEQRLTARGCNVSDLRARGHFVTADARATLGRFMRGDIPDPELFRQEVGAVIARSCAERPGRPVRAYGEMVDVLWRDGNREGAIRLEELWNNLASTYEFSLLCAYQMGNFAKSGDTADFDRVCHQHGHVVPAENFYTSRDISRLQQRAAALEAEIEERKKLEDALYASLAENKRLYSMAMNANRAKDELLATLSHELRTPLTAILGWARLLRGGDLDDGTVEKALETIERSARNQALLIDDLIDLSAVVTGKLTLDVTRMDLTQAVENAIAVVEISARTRQITIALQRPVRPAIVTGDPLRLQQVAWNLLMNAVKFSSAGSRVTVAVEVNDDNVCLRVIDAGIGIERDFLPHVFEPFRQADSSSIRKFGGLGLGLALVRHIVEGHGGTVRAESDGPGTGACFTVELPRA